MRRAAGCAPARRCRRPRGRLDVAEGGNAAQHHLQRRHDRARQLARTEIATFPLLAASDKCACLPLRTVPEIARSDEALAQQLREDARKKLPTALISRRREPAPLPSPPTAILYPRAKGELRGASRLAGGAGNGLGAGGGFPEFDVLIHRRAHLGRDDNRVAAVDTQLQRTSTPSPRSPDRPHQARVGNMSPPRCRSVRLVRADYPPNSAASKQRKRRGKGLRVNRPSGLNGAKFTRRRRSQVHHMPAWQQHSICLQVEGFLKSTDGHPAIDPSHRLHFRGANSDLGRPPTASTKYVKLRLEAGARHPLDLKLDLVVNVAHLSHTPPNQAARSPRRGQLTAVKIGLNQPGSKGRSDADAREVSRRAGKQAEIVTVEYRVFPPAGELRHPVVRGWQRSGLCRHAPG